MFHVGFDVDFYLTIGFISLFGFALIRIMHCYFWLLEAVSVSSLHELM